MRFERSVTFLFITIVLPIGCATTLPYAAPQLPRDQVALIKSSYVRHNNDTVSISAIDGKGLADSGGNVVILPGRHRLKLFVTTVSTMPVIFGDIFVDFEAEAGRTYALGGEIRHGTAAAWIVDEKTKEVVGKNMRKIAQTGEPG